MTEDNVFSRVFVGNVVRLKYADPVLITSVEKVGDVITVIASSKLPENVDTTKVGTIHWVSEKDAKPAEIRLYERLFTIEQIPKDLSQLHKYIAPNTKVVTQGFINAATFE